MKHCFVNAGINSFAHASTSCDILVKMGAVTSEFETATFENVPRFGCNLTIFVYLAH